MQSGWLRLGHRAATAEADLRLTRSYTEQDFEPVPVGEWVKAEVAIPSVAHPVRRAALPLAARSACRTYEPVVNVVVE